MICCRILLTNVNIMLKYSCCQDIDDSIKIFADILPDEWPGSLYDSALTVTIGGNQQRKDVVGLSFGSRFWYPLSIFI